MTPDYVDPRYAESTKRGNPQYADVKIRKPGREVEPPAEPGELHIPKGSAKGPAVRRVENLFTAAPRGNRDKVLRQGYSVVQKLTTADITTPRTDARAQGVSATKNFQTQRAARRRRGIK